MTLKTILLLLPALLTTCWAHAQFELSGATNRKLQELVEFNPVFERGHTGFALYDLTEGRYLYGYNADRLFVPASNNKLVTFYAAHRILGGRAPALVYQDRGTETAIWGTGYPLLLHPKFMGFDELTRWIRSAGKPLRLHFPPERGAVSRYGAGWSWDDWNYGYVYERSAFPVYGNRLFLDLQTVDSTGRKDLVGSPPTIAGGLQQDPFQRATILRSEFGNDFTVGPRFFSGRAFPIERALRLSPRVLVNELQAEMPEVRINLGTGDYPSPATAATVDVPLPDTLYRRMLRQSDNFLAEQLLLLAASKRYGYPAEDAILDYVQDTLLPPLGVEGVKFADASGLSRYSLFSPRHLARIVMALDQEVGRERLLGLLPAGGENGTLTRRFDDAPEVYVWAKTGSLSGVVCLSGILRTQRGKWLAFSFLHNNFTQRTSAYYGEMERTLRFLYLNL